MSASVFPARAGMSPATASSSLRPTRVPRASGDEPRVFLRLGKDERVFPARAGMSPSQMALGNIKACVPRASGDEPNGDTMVAAGVSCSPRERG